MSVPRETMKLIEITRIYKPSPSRHYEVHVEHDGKRFSKSVYFKDIDINPVIEEDRLERGFVRAIRELDRDIAYSEHGNDFSGFR